MRKIVGGAVLCILGMSCAIGVTPYDAMAYNNLTTVTYPYYAFVEDPENPWASVWDALNATDTIQYSDEFFAESSYGDHPELRAASYALALAGFENEADGYPAIETNHKLYTLLNDLGFSDYQSWDTASEENGHSMGTTIAHKTIDSGELIVVAPRNYNYMTEWLSNFNVGTNGDHAGFAESADLVVDRLNQYITDRNLTDYKIWMVGYSRGGAVVDLAAKTVNSNLDNYDMAAEDFYVYTFGAPKASMVETKYQNIHDVKDGNDLLLGYLFPEAWGFYNIGIYEEIHAADLEISTFVIDITDFLDPDKAIMSLVSNEGQVIDVGNKNGKVFIDEFLEFMTSNGLTREYFDSNIKPSLSAIMQAYQLRTIDKQSEFTDFIKGTNPGMLGMIARNAFIDMGNYPSLDKFPPYIEIVNILEGRATDEDIANLANSLKQYIGEYQDYKNIFGKEPAVTETEFSIIKENLPLLIKAVGPLLVKDATYTIQTYGENRSMYFLATLIANAENLVYGHIPESIMPILKSLIPDDPVGPVDPVDPGSDPSDEPNEDALIPDTGTLTSNAEMLTGEANAQPNIAIVLLPLVILSVSLYLISKFVVKR